MGERLDETAGLLEACGCASEAGELAEKVWFGFLGKGFDCHFCSVLLCLFSYLFFLYDFLDAL